jgi:hypothetical protein
MMSVKAMMTVKGSLRTRSAILMPSLALVPILGVALLAGAEPTSAQPAPNHQHGSHAGHAHPLVLSPVAAPRVTAPPALPHRSGSVPLRRSQTVRPVGPLNRKPATGSLPAKTLSSTAAAGSPVQLRALVIAVDDADWGVATWKATLDRVGAAYDVLHTRTDALTAATLVRPDAVGRYNAILLTSSMLLYDSGSGFVSGLSPDEWNTLWAYERDYAVRQATLYASYGSWPENYCLSGSSEGGVGDTPLNAALTTTGAGIFDYLKATATVPIVQSYVYRTRVTTGCAGQPVLANGDDVLGVQSTSTDGRERLALTFTSNQYLMQSNLLTYGLLRWATRGLFFGEQRHYLNVDADDWFNSADHYFPDGHIDSNPGYSMSGHDAYNLSLRQTALRGTYPLANDFTITLAYNGGDADLTAGSACSPSGGVDTLTATTRCLAGSFHWINHTLTHPELNFTDYATSFNEIAANRTVATAVGLSAPNEVLKTGEYSGLGVYNPNPNDDVSPPTDHGLLASNPNLLNAARDLGVHYLHGNMSFPSHVPSCFNCGIVHPMEPSITVVPDWPTNIAYHCTAPDEETAFYNSYYGPSGRFPYWPTNRTYPQVLDYEAEVALGHVASGSIYAHTLHIANLRDYSSGSTLLSDWVDKILAKYSAYYSVPLLNTAWPDLAAKVTSRNAHFAELAANASAVYDPASGTIAVTSAVAGQLSVSGAAATGSSTYGSDVTSAVTLTAGGTATVPASPRA